MYILMTSDEQFDEFELNRYGRSDIILKCLQPVIKLSTKARWALFGNFLYSMCGAEKKLNILLWFANLAFSSRLHDCNITESGCLTCLRFFHHYLMWGELDLSNNSLQDTGVEILSAGGKKSSYAPNLCVSME